MLVIISCLLLSLIAKEIELTVKLIAGLYPKFHDRYNVHLGQSWIFSSDLFVIATGINLNLWITYYIKIGK